MAPFISGKHEQDIKTCLDIAVDHRMRPLFKPVTLRLSDTQGTHLQDIEELGRTLVRNRSLVPEDETKVAVELARPISTGGIGVVISQPPDDLPYDEGLFSVIVDSPTLHELEEAFSIVSCGTLTISGNVSLFDRVPFIYDAAASSETQQIKVWAIRAIKGKAADVLLCLGGRNVRSGHFLEGGAGEVRSVETEEGDTQQIVASFDPSCAVNFSAYQSCYKERLLWEVAHVCGLYRDDWLDDDWVDTEWAEELRVVCDSKAWALQYGVREPPQCESVDHLLSAMASLKSFLRMDVGRGNHEWRDATDREAYSRLRDSKASKYCNDISLCLREMDSLPVGQWERTVNPFSGEWVHRDMSNLVRDACNALPITQYLQPGCSGPFKVEDMKRLLVALENYSCLSHDQYLSVVVLRFLDTLNLVCARKKRRLYSEEEEDSYSTWISDLADCFLKLAVEIEDFLAELRLKVKAHEAFGHRMEHGIEF